MATEDEDLESFARFGGGCLRNGAGERQRRKNPGLGEQPTAGEGWHGAQSYQTD
jgi:hypothetical protein